MTVFFAIPSLGLPLGKLSFSNLLFLLSNFRLNLVQHHKVDGTLEASASNVTWKISSSLLFTH